MLKPSSMIMERAIALAREGNKIGGHAVGAVIVKDGTIISEAFTTAIRDNDPTAHAEINAIRLAGKMLKSRKLNGCYLYTTYEPCPMCAAACVWARMAGIVYGASGKDATPECSWRIAIPSATVIAAGDPKLELYPEFMRDECKPLLSLSAESK